MLVPQQNEQICGVCCGTSIIPKIKEVTNYTFKERKKKKKQRMYNQNIILNNKLIKTFLKS